MRRTVFFIMIVLIGFAPSAAQAQVADDDMTQGILAFREGRYQQAIQAFENVVGLENENAAEAHFLLARIFFETSMNDRKRAEQELNAALKIEPENVKYMVALMQSLRVESWNFFQKRAREIKRGELAVKILRLDSLNSFAHQELGESFIRDFWRYRNAVIYPHLLFARSKNLAPTVIDPLDNLVQRQDDVYELLYPEEGQLGFDEEEAQLLQTAGFLDPQSILMADQFDLETLKAQGINVQDLSSRADVAYDRAIGHLYQAIESDPRQRTAYTDLMRIFALKGEFQEALTMLEQMYLFFPEDPELWTFLGYAHHFSGNLEAAAKVFETAFQFMDDDTRFAYDNLNLILPEDEKQLYQEDAIAFAARYWTSQDPRYLTPYNERKMEHYARLTYADLLYGAAGIGLRGWNTERGQIIVRYGPPIGDVVVIPQSTLGASQSIRANPNEGPPLDEGATATTSRLLKIVRDGIGEDMFEEANTYNIWTYENKKFVFEDPFRNGEYRLYSPPANDISQGVLPWVNDYAMRARETFRREPENYEYKAPGRQIDVPFLVSSFKNFNSDLTDVYVNFGIPVSDFERSVDLLNVTANAGMFVVGENRDMLVEQRRTIYGLRTDQVVQFKESNLWVDSERLRVPPGRQEVSVEFETTGAGTVAVQRRDVEILDFSGEDFALSDLLLAYRVDENPDGSATLTTDILRNGLSIMPAPWSVFSTEQPIYLYFEVYNLSLDDDGNASYQIEAALAPKRKGNVIGNLFRGIFGGGDDGVAVSVPVQVPGANDGQYFILDATKQEPGLYTLVVSITDQVSGDKLERVQDLFLE